MRNTEMARTYLEQAKARLETAKRAYEDRNYAFAVRQSQECVELSVKAVLRLYGVEYPREHDVGMLLFRLSDRFPSWFSKEFHKLVGISAELAKCRGPSMYGDEERGVPPSQLFGKDEAAKALRDAEFTYGLCGKLFHEFLRKSR